jgi:hypothetical protein
LETARQAAVGLARLAVMLEPERQLTVGLAGLVRRVRSPARRSLMAAVVAAGLATTLEEGSWAALAEVVAAAAEAPRPGSGRRGQTVLAAAAVVAASTAPCSR